MGQISNRILISSVNDGTTIHGALRATKSLTQGWTGAAAIPNWEDLSSEYYHPIVYLTLFNGNTQINPTSYSWYYNGTLLTFDSSGMSTNSGMVGWFKDSFEDPDGASGIGQTRCLTICHNLASGSNVDIDLISIRGTVEIGGAPVNFESGIDVTISKIDSNGYLGILSFVDGKCTVNGDSDYVSVIADLQTGGSTPAFGVAWQFNAQDVSGSTANNIQFYTTNAFTTTSSTPTKYVRIYGRKVTDIATLVCKFYVPATVSDSNLQTSASVVIDDVGDPEYLYIRYKMNGGTSPNDGAPVSLHSGQYVTYNMWVARADDSNSVFSTFNRFYVQPHNASGALINGSSFGKAQSPEVTHTSSNLRTGTYSADGFVEVTASTTTDNGTSVTGGVFSVDYIDTAWNGGNISMIVIATEGARS